MSNVDVKGRVRIYRHVNGERILIHDNHNVITYGGRSVMARLMNGSISLSHWSLHYGVGWKGMFGEPDPSIKSLYQDVSTVNPTDNSESIIYRMRGGLASGTSGTGNVTYTYPEMSVAFRGIPASITTSTATTINDPREPTSDNTKNSFVVSTIINGVKSIEGYPVNELGLYFNPNPPPSTSYVSQDGAMINEDKNTAILFAYEPIYDAVFQTDTDQIEVEWHITF